MKKIKILVLTAGSSPSIGVIKSLASQKEIPVHIIAADSDNYSSGFGLTDEKLIVPKFSNKNFIEFLFNYCIKNNIQYIFPPVLNEGLRILSKNENLFKQKGVKIFICKYSSLLNVINKKKMIDICLKEEVSYPKTFFDIRDVKKNDFPLIIKPSVGSGTADVWRLDSYKELKFFFRKVQNPIIQRYIKAQEFTIDVLNTEKDQFVTAVPRLRLRVKNGQSFQGQIVSDPKIINYAKRLSRIFKLNGPANIQILKERDEIYLVEINPKFGAGSILTFENGVNIPLLYLKIDLGMKISKKELTPKNGTVMSRYWEEVYFNE